MKPIRGRLAQLVERTLSMREVGGSKPPMSNIFGEILSILQTTLVSLVSRSFIKAFAIRISFGGWGFELLPQSLRSPVQTPQISQHWYLFNHWWALRCLTYKYLCNLNTSCFVAWRKLTNHFGSLGSNRLIPKMIYHFACWGRQPNRPRHNGLWWAFSSIGRAHA